MKPSDFTIDLGSDGSCMIYWYRDGVRVGVGYSRGTPPGFYLDRLVERGVPSEVAARVVDHLPAESIGLRAQIGIKS